jgi:hypothetical protein
VQALLGLAFLLLTLLVGGCHGARAGEGRTTTSNAKRLAGHGISLRLPSGWDGRITVRGFPLPGAAIVSAASSPLPAATNAARTLRRNDVLLSLSETLRDPTLTPETPRIPLPLRGAVVGRHSVVDEYFITGGRAFTLHATFGARRPPRNLIRHVNALLASLAVAQRTQPLRPGPDPAPAEALAPVRLLPTPPRVLTQCRRAQARSPLAILCPIRLPRPSIGWPRNDHVPKLAAQPLPGPNAVWRSRSDPRYRKREAGGVTIAYGAPWEPDSGPDWRLHLWRNRPCCFLHVEVFRRPEGRQQIPAGARPAILGGHRGLLKDATSYGLGSRNDYLYFPNHTRFLWRENGVAYVATLHRFGTTQETRALLARLIRELRPVRRIS